MMTKAWREESEIREFHRKTAELRLREALTARERADGHVPSAHALRVAHHRLDRGDDVEQVIAGLLGPVVLPEPAPEPETVPAELPELAQQINALHDACLAAARDAVSRAIEIGHLLVEAKGQVRHGEWADWVESHCSFGLRQASNYMRAYRDRNQIGSGASDLHGLRGVIAKLAGPAKVAKPAVVAAPEAAARSRTAAWQDPCDIKDHMQDTLRMVQAGPKDPDAYGAEDAEDQEPAASADMADGSSSVTADAAPHEPDDAEANDDDIADIAEWDIAKLWSVRARREAEYRASRRGANPPPRLVKLDYVYPDDTSWALDRLVAAGRLDLLRRVNIHELTAYEAIQVLDGATGSTPTPGLVPEAAAPGRDAGAGNTVAADPGEDRGEDLIGDPWANLVALSQLEETSPEEQPRFDRVVDHVDRRLLTPRDVMEALGISLDAFNRRSVASRVRRLPDTPAAARARAAVALDR